jgi:hypothetical protein
MEAREATGDIFSEAVCPLAGMAHSIEKRSLLAPERSSAPSGENDMRDTAVACPVNVETRL